MVKFYLAYGSNLNKSQMSHRCPGAVPFGTAFIKDYELAFRRGVLDIQPCEGSTVPVGIWTITEEDEAALDVYEGFPRWYVKKDFDVVVRETGQVVRAMAYVMTGEHPYWPPNKFYWDTCSRGYNDFGFGSGPLSLALGISYAKSGDKEVM